MNQLALDFTQPVPAARYRDPETCHSAARDAARHSNHGRALVLKALGLAKAGLTDFELAELTGWQQTSIGKRRGECVAMGWVEGATLADGAKVKRAAPSGSLALVWRITEAGLRQVE